MLTYRLHGRSPKIEKGRRLRFPNEVLVELIFEPGDQFGVGARPHRTARKGSDAQVMFCLNTGKQHVLSVPPLEIVEASSVDESDGERVEFSIVGNRATAKLRVDTPHKFQSVLATLYVVIPLVMNLEHDEPISIGRVSGKVGANPFGWEYSNLTVAVLPATKEERQQRAVRAFEAIPVVTGEKNMRLLASLQYLHCATRLGQAGSTPYEFMAEVILNLSKSLEVLFGESRESVRSELRTLGYPNEVIESRFMPVMILRSELDVAHASVSFQYQDELAVIYEYLNHAADNFRELLKRVVAQVSEGKYQVKKWEPSSAGEKKKLLEKLCLSMTPVVVEQLKRSKRIAVPNEGKV